MAPDVRKHPIETMALPYPQTLYLPPKPPPATLPMPLRPLPQCKHSANLPVLTGTGIRHNTSELVQAFTLTQLAHKQLLTCFIARPTHL